MSDEPPDNRAKELFQRIIQLRLPVKNVRLQEENGRRMKGSVTIETKTGIIALNFNWIGCDVLFIPDNMATFTSNELKYPTTHQLIKIVEKQLKKEA